MEMPTLRRLRTSRRTVDAFGGLNRCPRTGEGEFAQMENLSSDFYPVLAPCPPREKLEPAGVTALGAGQSLFYTQGTELVLGDRRIDLGLTPEGPKQLVKMGAYVVVFPDRKYASTLDGADFGSLEARFEGNGIDPLHPGRRRPNPGARTVRRAKGAGKRHPLAGHGIFPRRAEGVVRRLQPLGRSGNTLCAH